MTRVDSEPTQAYAVYGNNVENFGRSNEFEFPNERDVPPYFNLPNLIKVSYRLQ